jgi:hypothetical protein
MAGRVVDHCCCAKEADTGCTRAVKSADCCERIDADARAGTGTLRATVEVPPAVLASTLALPSRALPYSFPDREAIRAGRGPPPTARLFVTHCAFLI